VDTEAMGQLLLRLEADAHRAGWDAPAALYVLYDARDLGTDRTYRQMMRWGGVPTRRGPYAAISAAPPGSLDGYPQHGLFRMALNFSHSDHPATRAMLGVLRQPGFLGAAFVCEAWSRETDDQAEREAWRGKRFADMPGSMEIRTVNAADVGGADWVVRRVRGDKPKMWTSGDPGLSNVEGSVVESLRMVVAVTADLPRPELKTTPTMWSWDDQRHASEEGL
jgi:hypothetical protein